MVAATDRLRRLGRRVFNSLHGGGAGLPGHEGAGPLRKVGVTLAVGIAVFPVVFAWLTLRGGHTRAARALAFSWLTLFLIFAAANGRSVDASGVETPGKARPPAADTARPERYVTEPCHALARLFGPRSPLSDLQKDERWKSYKGRPFKWNLRVVEVSSRLLGGYTVQYKCARSRSLIQDVQVRYPAGRKTFVLGLEKGTVYEVSGKLMTQSTLLGMTADDAS